MRNRWVILCVVMAFIYALSYIKTRENTDIILSNIFLAAGVIILAIKDVKK